MILCSPLINHMKILHVARVIPILSRISCYSFMIMLILQKLGIINTFFCINNVLFCYWSKKNIVNNVLFCSVT